MAEAVARMGDVVVHCEAEVLLAAVEAEEAASTDVL